MLFCPFIFFHCYCLLLSAQISTWLICFQNFNGCHRLLSGRTAYLAYISEGLRDKQNLDEILTYQRENGSLFNSPSATAATTIHRDNTSALRYVELIGNMFGSLAQVRLSAAVALTKALVMELHVSFCISCYLQLQWCINKVACPTLFILSRFSFRSYEEELIMDMEACAVAFRLLRKHGYSISSGTYETLVPDFFFHFLSKVCSQALKTLVQKHFTTLLKNPHFKVYLKDI